MTTRITVKNENQGEPYADWDVEIVDPAGDVQHTLKPGQSVDVWLWHDGREHTIREKPKS